MLRLKPLTGNSIFTVLVEFVDRKKNRKLRSWGFRKGVYMSAKLERIAAERDKARRKRDEWDARVKELERKYREEENSEIHDIRSGSLSSREK